MRNSLCLLSVVIYVSLVGCDRQQDQTADTLFLLHDNESSGIDFSNDLVYNEQLNTYTFKNFYNGGGVGLGDFNNDGLLDVFFAGNMVSNKLYLNKGAFHFEDITKSAGLETSNVWTTGVCVLDINADSLLDIYICKSGPPEGNNRTNELYINNGDLTFTENAKAYGLDFKGLSTHAAFFDYDKDGDLDCYLLSNSIRSVGGYDLRANLRHVPDPLGGNKLLKNDSSRFVDVSAQSGIFTSEIGFGLGVTIGDINLDGWPDVYVSNDFFERDYLYINNQNGTFTESLTNYMREISLGSMGADMADINNDGLPEVFVTEMLPETDARLKTTTQFDSWNKYMASVNSGYHHQFSRNTLQLNRNGSFSEVSRLAGVHATDWSWGALIFDMDNDGLKDIFVANGIYKDLLNQDYVNFVADPVLVKEMVAREKNVITRLIDSIPSTKIPNYAFNNINGIQFANKASEWGFGAPTFSNGSAYGDLDNDGDLDLILSNVNMPASVFENRSDKLKTDNNHLTCLLRGSGKNIFAVGAKVTLIKGNERFYQELSPMRGFMSSVDYRLQFGLGHHKSVDSLIIEWPDLSRTIQTNVPVNQFITVNQAEANFPKANQSQSVTRTIFTNQTLLIDFKHAENEFVDFDRDRLLFNMVSNEGPCLCVADVNADGRDDFYVGGAKNQAGALYVQQASGAFSKISQSVFDADKVSEDTDCSFFDANGDNKPDLYVTSGGNEFSASSSSLLDRLYINLGGGKFEKSKQLLPVITTFESTSTVQPADFDKDGDIDLFVGVRLKPFYYGVPCNGYLLQNDGQGNFSNVTKSIAPGLDQLGLITDSKWGDINGDEEPDLVVVGEWMPVTVFLNANGKFSNETKKLGLSETQGWYNTIELADFNKDGRNDIVAGNHGLNSRFKASASQPIQMHVNDFDQNGVVEQIYTQFNEGKSYPLVLRHDLVSQIPALKKKYLHFRNYKEQTIEQIFPPEVLKKSIVLTANKMNTSIWLNGENGFIETPLPLEAQFAPVYAIEPGDYNQDGNTDLLLGGNLYRAKPETGIYDASYGLLLQGDGKGSFKPLTPLESGVFITGEIRAFKKIKWRDKRAIAIAKNNDRMEFLIY